MQFLKGFGFGHVNLYHLAEFGTAHLPLASWLTGRVVLDDS